MEEAKEKVSKNGIYVLVIKAIIVFALLWSGKWVFDKTESLKHEDAAPVEERGFIEEKGPNVFDLSNPDGTSKSSGKVDSHFNQLHLFLCKTEFEDIDSEVSKHYQNYVFNAIRQSNPEGVTQRKIDIYLDSHQIDISTSLRECRPKLSRTEHVKIVTTHMDYLRSLPTIAYVII